MSDSSQGPGWWLASDGKWYPPEQAPQPQAPQPPPPTPAPSGTPPPTPQQGSSTSGVGKGCIIALVAFAALIVLGVVGAIAAIAFLGDTAVDKLEEAVDEDPCPFVSDEKVSSVLGSGNQAVQLTGLYAFLEPVTDTRVLADATDCVVISSGNNSAALARLARYQGSDASAMFDREKDVADGTSQDQGGGLSIETQSYMSDQSVTVGDEGFCTTSDILSGSGVLVRDGDTLVYVSIQTDFSNTETPSLDLEGGGFAPDEANCTLAQEMADAILG